METPSLQYNALFQPFSRNPATVLALTCEPVSFRNKNLLLFWPSCFLSPLWMFPQHRASCRFLIQEEGISPILKLSGTAGIALQILLTYLALLLRLFSELWLLLELELQKYHMHRKEKKKTEKKKHLVLSVSCHKSDLPVLTFLPSSEIWGTIPGNPSVWGSQDHPAAVNWEYPAGIPAKRQQAFP